MSDWKYQPARDLDLPRDQRLLSIRRESGLLATCAQAAWWTAAHGYLACAHRLKIIGREHLPTAAPFVLVANHASRLDVFCLASALPLRLRERLLPIAAGDVFFQTHAHARLSSWLLNALPMWRHNCGPHALKELRTRLVEEPCGYVLFPEGTRSRDGELGEFKAGAGMLVAGTPAPVVPCYIEGAHAAWPPARRWPRPGAVRLHVGKPLRFDDLPNRRASWREVVEQLDRAVRDLREQAQSPSQA